MEGSDHLAPGTVVAGRYRTVRRLGEGGMGAVYEVIDVLTNRRRALKRMLASLSGDADLSERFRREATVAGRVESEHVVEVLDAGVDEAGAPFLVMELLRGQDLGRVLAQAGPLSPDVVVAYLAQV